MLTSNPHQRVLWIAVLLVVVVSLAPLGAKAAPPQQSGGIVYFVRPGDTLFWISQRFGTNVMAIMTANGMSSDSIQAGQRLVIPLGGNPYGNFPYGGNPYGYYPNGGYPSGYFPNGYPYGNYSYRYGSIYAPQPLPPITPIANPTFTCTYAAQRGDTIFSIAYRARVSVPALMQANTLSDPLIFVNQQIKVPCDAPTASPFPTYTVAAGDNLFRIAVKNNTSIYALQLVNSIPNPHLVFAGQTLVIPYPNSYVWQNVPPPPYAITTHPVISQFRTRGPNGVNDEFIELYNPTSATYNIGSWLIKVSTNNATVDTRVSLNANTNLAPGQHYLVSNNNSSGGYSGSVGADQSFSNDIPDDGGIALTMPDGTVIDQVGMSIGSAYKEVYLLAPLTTNTDRAYERKLGGASGNCYDANNNAADFYLQTPSEPRDLASAAIVCTAIATATPGGPTLTPTITPVGTTSTGTTSISIQNNSFIPAQLTVPVGTTVTWKNNDLGTHTIRSGVPGAPTNPLQSGPLSSTQTWSYTFGTAGTYSYFDEIYGAAMTGQIKVGQ